LDGIQDTEASLAGCVEGAPAGGVAGEVVDDGEWAADAAEDGNGGEMAAAAKWAGRVKERSRGRKTLETTDFMDGALSSESGINLW